MSPVAKSRVAGAWVDSSLSGGARVAGAWVYFSPPSGGNPEETLFSNQVPSAQNNSDGGLNAYTLGVYFMPAVSGVIKRIRWFFPTAAQPGGVAIKARLFRTSDTFAMCPQVTFASPGSPGAWNEVSIGDVAVAGGTQYCAAIWTPERYVATTGGGSEWPLTNGNLSTDASAGRFQDQAGTGNENVTMPVNAFNNGNYYVDVVFVAD
jgi:uncharacterized protein DUF4082